MGDKKVYGYVRVSSRDQNEERQLIAMHSYGLSNEQLVVEKQSGKDFERPKYRRLLKKLKPGDSLVVKSIDRLGRNYEEILEQWRRLTKERQVNLIVLDMPLLDSRIDRDLTGTLIADIVLQLLSYVAETERANIRQRQAEGIAAAKARGVRFGHPPIPMPEHFEELKCQWQEGKITSRKAGELLGISYQTFLRRVKKIEQTAAKENADGML